MIRKVYKDLIIAKCLNDGPLWLLKRCRQYMLLLLSARLKRPLCGPALGTLMVTYRCNLRCTMCDMPGKADCYHKSGEKEFSTERFKELIREFAELGTPGIGFTGGEPLLREDIFELMAETRRQGMIAHLNTNGWLLDDTCAHRLIESGVDSVNISLDGATADTHDRIRARSGAFDHAIAAVERLVRLKKTHNSPIRIKTVAVISETNIGEVPEMLALGRKLGISCVELIPRQPFTGQPGNACGNRDLLEKVDRLVGLLTSKEYAEVPLENSPAHVRLFHASFAGLPSPVPCRAGYNSLAVDCYGNLFPCVPWINWGRTTGSIVNDSLSRIWNSHAYQTHRETTGLCRDCYLNCQTELNLLFHIQRSGTRISP